MDPRISIIILNWNGWRDTLKCLESLYQITYPNFEVVVLDNGSKDDSVEKIRAWAKGRIKVESTFFEYTKKNKPIRYTEHKRQEIGIWDGGKARERTEENARELVLIRNEKNYGFSEGNNIGAKYAMKAFNPDYIFLLNNDTVVEKRFLNEIVRSAQRSYPDAGELQSKLMIMDDAKRIDSTGGFITRTGEAWDRGWGEIDRGQYDKDTDIFYAKGAALMIRSDVVRKVGLFDPRYVIYYDDTDLAWRVRLNGYKVLLSPNSLVYHAGSGTMKKQPSSKTVFTLRKNRVATLIKNYGSLNLIKSLTRILIGDITRRTISTGIRNTVFPVLERRKDGGTSTEFGPSILRAYFWNIAHIQYLWKERVKNQRLLRRIPDSLLPFKD